MKLLILRPEPGASATATRAAADGFDPLVVPLFTIRSLAWEAPAAGRFDTIAITSANAVRYGGAGVGLYMALPAYTVGPASADAARDAGLRVVGIGDGDGDAMFTRIAADGHRRVLHLCGSERSAVSSGPLEVTAVPVYASGARAALPADAVSTANRGAVVLIHSPRAAATWARLADAAGVVRSGVDLVAISPAAARTAGGGWRSVHAPLTPREPSMLAIARRLCQNARP